MTQLEGYDTWKQADPAEADICPGCDRHHLDCACPVDEPGPEDYSDEIPLRWEP